MFTSAEESNKSLQPFFVNLSPSAVVWPALIYILFTLVSLVRPSALSSMMEGGSDTLPTSTESIVNLIHNPIEMSNRLAKEL